MSSCLNTRVTRVGILIVTLLLMPVTGVMAETVYVLDTLRVGIRPEPSNNVAPVDVVVTGMKLEVTDSAEGYIRVRTDKGVEGWIKKIYVSDKLPAQLEVEKLRKENALLNSEKSKSSELIKAAEQTKQALSIQVDELKQQNNEMRLELLRRQDNANDGGGSIWYLWLGLLLVLLVIGGFAGGISWHRHQTMKRLGGLRV